MDEATRERNHQTIMRDLGRIEGRVDAVERRVGDIDQHLKSIDDKLDGLLEVLNKRIGKDEGRAGFWAVLAVLMSMGIAGASLYYASQAGHDHGLQTLEGLKGQTEGRSPGPFASGGESDPLYPD